MANTITIELCAEDRARLDRLTAALEKRAAQEEPTAVTITDPIMKKLAETVAKADTPEKAHTEAPKNATGAAKPDTLTTTPPAEEKPAEPTDAPKEEAKPTLTLELIQQKVVQLASGADAAKKAKVRAIVNTYGAKVSDLKDQPEKWAEVWGKLTKLEKEG